MCCPLRRSRRLARPHTLDGNGNRRLLLLLLHLVFLLHIMDPLRRVLLLLLQDPTTRALRRRRSSTRSSSSSSGCPLALRSSARVFQHHLHHLAFPAPRPRHLGWIVVSRSVRGVVRLGLGCAPLCRGRGGSWRHVHICLLAASRSSANTLRGLWFRLWIRCSCGWGFRASRRLARWLASLGRLLICRLGRFCGRT